MASSEDVVDGGIDADRRGILDADRCRYAVIDEGVVYYDDSEDPSSGDRPGISNC